MRFANVRELKNKTSEILRLAQEETIVITSNGKPRAIIKGVSESTFEEYLAAPARMRHPNEMKIAESESVSGYTDNRPACAGEPESRLSAAKLKAVFWDYPDLADEKRLTIFLKHRRDTNDQWALEWALSRFLERGRAVDAMKYFGLDEIRAMLPKLRLSPYARKKWTRILEVYEHP